LEGSNSSKKRGETIEDLKSGNLHTLIATSLADEGLDIPNLDVLILAGSGKSKTKALQRIGRVIRPYEGKKQAVVIDFMDQSKYCKKHSLLRKKIYNSEEAFNFKIIDHDYLLDNEPSKISKIIEYEKNLKSSII